MYKEACKVLKRAGFWQDFKNYADQNDWVRPTLYGLGGAAAGGGIGAGVGALMGPENRGAKIGISSGVGGLFGGLAGLGGGLAHNRHNRKSREYQAYLAQQIKRALQIGDEAVAAQRQKNTEAKEFMRRAKEQEAFKVLAKQQDASNKAQNAWHAQQAAQAKADAEDRKVSDWAQGKIDGYMDTNGNLKLTQVHPEYYNYPDSSGDLQDAYMYNYRDNRQAYEDSMVDQVVKSHPQLYASHPERQARVRELLQRTFANTKQAQRFGAGGMSDPALLDELRQNLQDKANFINANKQLYFGGGPYVR